MSHSLLLKPLSLVCLLISLNACQGLRQQHDALLSGEFGNKFARCMYVSREFREQVASEKAVNASAPSVSQLPLLHSNRFLNHLAGEVNTDEQIKEWFSLTSALGKEIRRSENLNLNHPWPEQRLQELNSCAQEITSGSDYSVLRSTLLNQIETPEDHYSALPQWLGFNWLLRPIFSWRIKQLHAQEQLWFEQDTAFDKTVSYSVNSVFERENNVKAWFREAYGASPLQLPTLSAEQLQTLYQLHAPDFTVELDDDNDRIGTPTIVGQEFIINTSRADVFVLPSYTEFDESNLLQLNYVIWFSERKPQGWPDLYSGEIDSLIWRVTLDEQGDVLLYDSIHSCGCYHKYFMMADSVSAKQPADSNEPANIFDLRSSKRKPINVRPHVSLTANDHYVVDINFDKPASAASYELSPYSRLSHLNNGTGSKSFFSESGIIEHSKRLERYTLWPTGIESVGAMRQWGTHATGFVAQQQFDDAKLLDHYFTRTN